MKNEFMLITQYEDDLIELIQQSEDTFAIALKKDLDLLPYILFEHLSPIKIKPMDKLYNLYAIPCEPPIPSYFTLISELDDTANQLRFYLYNITGKQLILEKGEEIGYIKVAKSLIKEYDNAYYKNDYLCLKELRKNTIKTFKYVIDANGKHSLVLDLNKHFFENPFASDIILNETQDDIK
jgi:hypothetical protein